MSDDRMFAQLMETQPEQQEESPKSTQPQRKKTAAPEPKDELRLPDELENIGDAGYTSHSYRLELHPEKLTILCGSRLG
jgi:hypothetical protein